jgi:hypothetical protein
MANALINGLDPKVEIRFNPQKVEMRFVQKVEILTKKLKRFDPKI